MLDKNSLLYKIKKTLGIFIIRITETILSFYDNRVWIDKAEFPYTKVLEDNAAAIREEFLKVQNAVADMGVILPEAMINASDNNWKTFVLIAYGYDLIEHLESCPVTSRCLSQIPYATTALFSVIEPHKIIPPHRGEYKGVLRCHLGVIIPDPEKCFIEVNGIKRNWVEGECLFFDDTFSHYAVNNSAHRRVVLFIDILRQYPFPVNLLNNFIFRQISKSEFIQEVLSRSYHMDGVRSRPREIPL